jgi:hypothetical protein
MDRYNLEIGETYEIDVYGQVELKKVVEETDVNGQTVTIDMDVEEGEIGSIDTPTNDLKVIVQDEENVLYPLGITQFLLFRERA